MTTVMSVMAMMRDKVGNEMAERTKNEAMSLHAIIVTSKRMACKPLDE